MCYQCLRSHGTAEMRIVATEALWTTKPKIFTLWSFTVKVCLWLLWRERDYQIYMVPKNCWLEKRNCRVLDFLLKNGTHQKSRLFTGDLHALTYQDTVHACTWGREWQAFSLCGGVQAGGHAEDCSPSLLFHLAVISLRDECVGP